MLALCRCLAGVFCVAAAMNAATHTRSNIHPSRNLVMKKERRGTACDHLWRYASVLGSCTIGDAVSRTIIASQAYGEA